MAQLSVKKTLTRGLNRNTRNENGGFERTPIFLGWEGKSNAVSKNQFKYLLVGKGIKNYGMAWW